MRVHVRGAGRGDEPIGRCPEPQLRFVRREHPEEHVRDIRARELFIRLHSFVLLAAAPLGGVVAGEGFR